MKQIVLLVALVVFSLGCAGNLFKGQYVLGNGLIGLDCDDTGHCESVMRGGDLSGDFLNFMLRLVDAVPGVELGQAPAAPLPDIHFHAGPGIDVAR